MAVAPDVAGADLTQSAPAMPPGGEAVEKLPVDKLRADMARMENRLDVIEQKLDAVLQVVGQVGELVQSFAPMAEQLATGGLPAILGMLTKRGS